MWSWGFNKGVLCTHLGSKAKGRLLVLFLPIGCAMLMRPNKAETAVHACHYLGDMTVCMPDRGLVFEFVTCFYCSKGVTFVLDFDKCVPIPAKKLQQQKQDDPRLWVDENCTTHPLPRVQKLMTNPLSAPAHPPPILFDQSLG